VTKVVHCKKEKFDIYIGRPSKWGNPYTFKQETIAEFVVPKDEVLPKYEVWLKQQPELMESLHELRGKTLGCWCRPAKGFQGKVMCHGQILAALADGCRPEDIE
jgi:hypothetical protein